MKHATFVSYARRIFSVYLVWKAKLLGKAFICDALQGDSRYSICINTDLTVSCNCRDYDGSGQIGDLTREDLSQVFSGVRAKRFRSVLASGALPLAVCSRCWELRSVDKETAKAAAGRYTVPHRGIRIENTVSCNLKCLTCYNEAVSAFRKKRSMTLEDMRKVSGIIKAYDIKNVIFANLGEPFFDSEIGRQLAILKEDSPGLRIVTATNGLLVDTDEKREAALLFDEVRFSIDGIDQRTVIAYQKGGDFEKAYRNMRSLVEYRNKKKRQKPLVGWTYVLFNWNDNGRYIQRAIASAKEAGIDSLFFQPTVSPWYGISWRYYLTGYLRRTGEREWNGRMIRFEKKDGFKEGSPR